MRTSAETFVSFDLRRDVRNFHRWFYIPLEIFPGDSLVMIKRCLQHWVDEIETSEPVFQPNAHPYLFILPYCSIENDYVGRSVVDWIDAERCESHRGLVAAEIRYPSCNSEVLDQQEREQPHQTFTGSNPDNDCGDQENEVDEDGDKPHRERMEDLHDWALENFDLGKDGNAADLQKLVNAEAVKRGLPPYESVKGNGVAEAYKRAYERKHKRKYPKDNRGRGKSRKPNSELAK